MLLREKIASLEKGFFAELLAGVILLYPILSSARNKKNGKDFSRNTSNKKIWNISQLPKLFIIQ